MKKLEVYLIIKGKTTIELGEQVLYMVKNYDMELVGGAFWNGERYCQTVAKFS